MKVVAKPIKTVVVFEYEGENPIPYKFKLQMDDGEEKLIRIDRRISTTRQKVAGIEAVIYECQSVIDGLETRYRLKYLVAECKWQLYAI